MSTRLTKEMKKDLRQEIVKKKTEFKKKILKEEVKTIAIQLLKEVNEPYQKFITQIPEELTPRITKIYLEFRKNNEKESTRTVSVNVDSMKCALPFISKSWIEYACIDVKPLSEAEIRLQEINREELAIEEYEKELYSALRNIMEPVTTVEKLMKVFPEISEYCLSLIEEPFYPPAITTDKVKFLLEKVL